MDFRILGSLEALEQGERVALGGSRQRALLAVFLLHGNETLSTDRVVNETRRARPSRASADTVCSLPASAATGCGSTPTASTRTALSGSLPRAEANLPRAARR